jgi:hypothetical protein|tara:strand:- start:2147 stop:2392 length:246 start_codon:yes stop_codon:yes gene_type:complete
MSDNDKKKPKKEYTPGAKRQQIREVAGFKITKSGVRIPIGSSTLTLSGSIPKQKVSAKIKVPFDGPRKGRNIAGKKTSGKT